MTLKEKLALKELEILNPLVTDYLEGKKELNKLYTHAPQLSSISAAIKAKKGFENRELLVSSLDEQYKDLTISPQTKANIESLKQANTFTICTAHQLCLFTGPSYFIYKIMSAIKLAQVLKVKFPENNFVPVYWMGSEDHDFEEISSANVYSKTLKWENNEHGAVGNHSLAGLEDVIEELAEILGKQAHAEELIASLEEYFSEKRSYAQAFQGWILDLFKDYGLLVLNANDVRLKASFTSIVREELLNNAVEKELQKNERFLDEAYHVQASSRAINLFYLKDQLRERIERSGDGFKVVNTKLGFSEEDLLKELENHPERFSPNVFLRPVYQEHVLPNIAFVGGPGEVAYWLQLKDIFDRFEVPQPLILLRDMAVAMQKNHLDKLAEWDVPLSDLFTHYDEIAKKFVAKKSDNELSLNEEMESIRKVFDIIKEKAVLIDKNMERSVDAEQQKVFNSLSNLETKLIRAEKRNFDQQLSQLENIQSKLLPENTLQERYDNFIPVYLKHKEVYFDKLLETFNPFEQSLKVFMI